MPQSELDKAKLAVSKMEQEEAFRKSITIKCTYPMPDWTGGICDCSHATDQHEKLIKNIENKNDKPFNTTPNQFELIEKISPTGQNYALSIRVKDGLDSM